MLQSSALTRANLKAFTRHLKDAASEHFQVQESSLLEALSRGLGARTHASLLVQPAAPGPVYFDHAAFIARLTELSDERSAEAVGALLDGIRLLGAAEEGSARVTGSEGNVRDPLTRTPPVLHLPVPLPRVVTVVAPSLGSRSIEARRADHTDKRFGY